MVWMARSSLVAVALLFAYAEAAARRKPPTTWEDDLSHVSNTPSSAKASCPIACPIACPEGWLFVCPCSCVPPDDPSTFPPPGPTDRRPQSNGAVV
ncbi:hypothetical protein FA13DRAFT_1742666 [Coprinellus micaceus]|uniref:Uncharacterized protein n=1 Tax=Coprinellus micaceus TaxID=71717 RepID=A0A4Y7SG93_COPMI|nr:hypothetical protein FA13DRAFT_1742666 [Coprinellus micaceus]